MKKFLCLFLALAILFLFASCTDNKEETTSPDAQQTEAQSGVLSSFTAATLDGEPVTQEIFKGKKVTMVNIWATFCKPCINEMPDLQKLNEDFADKGFQVVGIVCDIYETDGVFDEDSIDLAKSIVEDTGVKYLNLLPTDDLKAAKLNEVTAVPETIFVDENGKQIGQSFVGSRTYDEWANIISSIL